ncbi:hypothetical protein MBLNU230_g6907t1 [Neophaeotheca triangularis]
MQAWSQLAQARRTLPPLTRSTESSSFDHGLAMPTIPTRPEFDRSQTWPLPKAETTMKSILEEEEEEDIDQDPQQHFLSPVQSHEYQPWEDGSDDEDGSEIEWDAGITDFALFDNDRRQAEHRQTELPSRWQNVLINQEQALQRSVKRTLSHRQLSEDPATAITTEAAEDTDMPSLTPDTSPDLGDLGDEFPDPPPPVAHSLPPMRSPSHPKQKQPKPAYLTVEITPPLPSEASIQENEDLPLSFQAPRRQAPSSSTDTDKTKIQRPGLRHARTMSGKLHSWRRPGWEIYALDEGVEEEGVGSGVKGCQIAR